MKLLDRSDVGVLEVAEVVAGAVDEGAAAAAKRRRVTPSPSPGVRRTGAGGGDGRRGGRRRVQADAAAVQRLFQACRAVFRGPGTVPKPAEVHLLCAMIDRMKPEDFGLSPDLKFFKTRDVAEGTPMITQTTIHKCTNFSMVIFFLPRNAVIPLHNHPGMTVFSKLLVGSMHIKSYDWVDVDVPADSSDHSNNSSCSSSSSSSSSSPTTSDQSAAAVRRRLAKLVVDDVFTAPCDTSVLYPTTGGNMHRFTAVAPCAVLDIMGPPYSIEDDRDCTYYTDDDTQQCCCSAADGCGDLRIDDEQQGDEGGRRRLAWLKEIDMPRELKMCGVQYGGPAISDK